MDIRERDTADEQPILKGRTGDQEEARGPGHTNKDRETVDDMGNAELLRVRRGGIGGGTGVACCG